MNMLQQPPFSPSQPLSPDVALPFNNLDPFAAKQMAALQATSIAKAGNRSAPGGVTSASYFGGLSTHQSSRPEATPIAEANGHFSFSSPPGIQGQGPPSNPHNMNPVAIQQGNQQKKRQFLHGLANITLQRGMPLPPQVTGVPYPPAYDPSTSPWRNLEYSNTDIGVVRLAGKDVDLYKLWAIVQQAGGGVKVTQSGMWGQFVAHLDLPEQHIQPNGQPQPTAMALQQHYNAICGPFEEAYRKNMREQQRGMSGRQQGGLPMPGGQGRTLSGMPGTFPPVGTLPAVNGVSNSGMMVQSANANSLGHDNSLGGMNGVNIPINQSMSAAQLPPNVMGGVQDPRTLGSMDGAALGPRRSESLGLAASNSMGDGVDVEMDGRKRKVDDMEDPTGKRARQKLGEGSELRSGALLNGPGSVLNNPSRLRQPSRRKISYVPFAREVETAGGRDLEAISQELAHFSQRPLKDLNEWGTVDVEALTMSLRSRLSTELSYGLTTFTLLTLVRVKDAGFPLAQAQDLFEELLDLVEDVAFDGSQESSEDDHPDSPIVTHRQLIHILTEGYGGEYFATQKRKQGIQDSSHGPSQRPGDIILAATNIIRNLSLLTENQDFLAKHPRLYTLLLRLCCLKGSTDSPTPLSRSLSLNDLITVRKDVINTLVNIASTIHLSVSPSAPTATEIRNARRAYDLLLSYIIDPAEAVAPYACLLLNGVPTHIHGHKPPSIVDTALEVFNRLSHPDDNRMLLSKAIPQAWLWTAIEALVHRLPMDNSDFQVIMRAEWLAYVERAIMAIYSIAFLAPPSVKKRMKTDRQLSFTKVMLRLIKKLTIYSPHDARVHFQVSSRRAVETLKLVDDAGDSFDSSPSTMPTLAFGMGYGEHGEARVERGMGLLSGHQEDITWNLMLQRDLDDQMFSELVSLVRVGC